MITAAGFTESLSERGFAVFGEVAYWPKADECKDCCDVCFWG
jgi:hypothetical protein